MTRRTGAAGTALVAALRPTCRGRAAAAGRSRRTERPSPAVRPRVASLAEPQIRTLASRPTPLALEWASGEPLADFLHREGPLAPADAIPLVRQLADALSAAHAAGIIHRDLKPENIMYDARAHSVKLLDFGIARDAELPPEERLTRTGFFVGTLQYVAPEALSGELVDGRADIYSLAKITYYMLTGRHPHDGRSPRELFQQLVSGKPNPPG